MVKQSLIKKMSFLFTIITWFLMFQTPVMAGKIKFNYASFGPPAAFVNIQADRWKVEVEKRTQGKIRINTFPSGTLLSAKGMMDGIIAGQADIGVLCMAYQPGRFIVTNASSLPIGIPDAKTGSVALLKLYEKHKPKAFDKVKVLTMFTTAPANIMSKVSINTMDDIKGLNLRASGGAAPILKAWGANPVGMPMPATVEALQKGTVKGLFSSLEVMKDFKFAENCKYVTLTNTVIYPFAVVMNMDKWNKLPSDIQKVMMDLKEEQAIWTGTYMDDHVAAAIDWSKKTEKVEFITLSANEQQKWDRKLTFLTEKWIKDANKNGFPGEAIVNDLKSYLK